MAEQSNKMKPIWYFVGLMLSAMGAIILISGLVDYFGNIQSGTVLASLHPELWWGAVMIIAGAIFLVANLKTTVE
jgi:hypothetical protein